VHSVSRNVQGRALEVSCLRQQLLLAKAENRDNGGDGSVFSASAKSNGSLSGQLKTNPNDTQALYSLGVAYALRGIELLVRKAA